MPDLWFYGILNILKKGRGSSNVRKIRAKNRPKTTHKYIITIKELVLNLAKIDWGVQIFSDFQFF